MRQELLHDGRLAKLEIAQQKKKQKEKADKKRKKLSELSEKDPFHLNDDEAEEVEEGQED